MNDQYYTREPESASHPVNCAVLFRGHSLQFETDAGVFSKGELDKGTELLLSALPPLHGAVLDMGCGWGPVGVSLKKDNPALQLTMVDVNLRALALSEKNAQLNGVQVEVLESDGFAALRGRKFDWVVTNPPIRAGKQVIYQMFADAAEQLNPDGGLCLVIRKQQGAESCMKYLKTLYAKVDKVDKSGGFWVLRATEPLKKENETQEEAADAHV